MACKRSENTEERFLSQQEFRSVSRLWKKVMEKQSGSKDAGESVVETEGDTKREVHFNYRDECSGPCGKLPSEAIQRKIAKGKLIAKIKSPLQKFDEVVTRELMRRRVSEEGRRSTFEGTKQWSTLQFSRSRLSDFGVGKISVEGKVSRGALSTLEKEVRNEDPSETPNPALMDAIERLAQAQAFCRFDAAVKAAEAATASVPPEKAEEVAVACAKDYQSEIVDVINQKISINEDKKPMEVIGYIGITKLKDKP